MVFTKRETNASLFSKLMELVEGNSRYEKIADIIDYTLPSREEAELTSYDFDTVATLRWGTSEGVYLSCYLEGTFDESGRKLVKAGTIKTLQTDESDFCLLGELSGLITYASRKYVDEHIELFS